MKSILFISIAIASFSASAFVADSDMAADIANALSRPQCQAVVNSVYKEQVLFELKFDSAESYQSEETLGEYKYKVTHYILRGKAYDQNFNEKNLAVHIRKSSPTGVISYSCELKL